MGEAALEALILDGQQRLTSLYRALLGREVVETKDQKGKPIRRWYYLDMKKAVANDDDREDALLSLPEDRVVKTFGGEIALDLSAPERQYARDVFPANHVFNSVDWRQAHNRHWNFAPENIQLHDVFEREVIKHFEQCARGGRWGSRGARHQLQSSRSPAGRRGPTAWSRASCAPRASSTARRSSRRAISPTAPSRGGPSSTGCFRTTSISLYGARTATKVFPWHGVDVRGGFPRARVGGTVEWRPEPTCGT